MLGNNVGGIPGLDLILQHQYLLWLYEREQETEQRTMVIRGVSWLRDPSSEPSANPAGVPPEVASWTCPRCRSHRCICTNPGNLQDPIYTCAVCGYSFHKESADRLLETEDQ